MAGRKVWRTDGAVDTQIPLRMLENPHKPTPIPLPHARAKKRRTTQHTTHHPPVPKPGSHRDQLFRNETQSGETTASREKDGQNRARAKRKILSFNILQNVRKKSYRTSRKKWENTRGLELVRTSRTVLTSTPKVGEIAQTESPPKIQTELDISLELGSGFWMKSVWIK